MNSKTNSLKIIYNKISQERHDSAKRSPGNYWNNRNKF